MDFNYLRKSIQALCNGPLKCCFFDKFQLHAIAQFWHMFMATWGGQGVTQKDHLLFNIFESICVSYTYLYVALRPLPIKPLEMGEVRQVEAQGPVPTFKLGVSLASGEILWPGWPYIFQYRLWRYPKGFAESCGQVGDVHKNPIL